MKLTLSCPLAKYDGQMRIICTKRGYYCGNSYFKRCKGWWVLTESAGQCPLREESNE